MKNKIASYILSYEITKGMKSFGPIGLLKSNHSPKELVLHQIDIINKLFKNTDINIITGFGHDKIQKKIPDNINIILNNHFLTSNQGYAFKLIMDSYDASKYDGIFITPIETIIKCNKTKIPSYSSSWIISQKMKKYKEAVKFLGPVANDNGKIEYIFYDVGDRCWSGSVYICNKDLSRIASHLGTYYDNMFLFEVINKSISQNIIYSELLLSNNELVHINGLKDKNKIREYA